MEPVKDIKDQGEELPQFIVVETISQNVQDFQDAVNDRIKDGYKTCGNFQMFPVMAQSKFANQPVQLMMYVQPMEITEDPVLQFLEMMQDLINMVTNNEEPELNNPISE